jgi:Na+/H+-dicarboxylate symporter/ABC-type amino acid transport substrate-binding protein
MTEDSSATVATGPAKRRFRIGLSQWILISLVLGVAFGLFFGESCRRLQPLGDSFIALLQMTILPYIILSLIGNIGGLRPAQAGILAKRAGLVQIAFWIVAAALICLLPLGLPELQQSMFFSSNVVIPSQGFDFLSFIPANPFRSMADNIVPASVIFSIAVGVALIPIEGKDELIRTLHVLSKALIRVGSAMASLTPIGVFALTASAAGQMTLDDLSKTQGYLLTYTLGSLLLTFVIMPAAVSAVTPFSFRAVLRHSKDAMIVGVTTANPLIALPLMITGSQKLFKEYKMEGGEASQTIETVIPIIYSFPNVGKLLMLTFLPFAGWYSGSPMTGSDYVPLTVTGILTFFGSVTVAVPYLLDMFQLPNDLFTIFIVASTIIIGRIAAMGAVMHMVALGLIVTCMTMNKMSVKPIKLVVLAVVSLALTLGGIAGARAYLSMALQGAEDKGAIIARMDLLTDPIKNVIRHDSLDGIEPDLPPKGTSRLKYILDRKRVRVGYVSNRMPWCYINAKGDLVGFNVDLAHELARDLEVELEFVPITMGKVNRQIQEGWYDLSISPIGITPSTLKAFTFSEPYIELNTALVVRDYDRQVFESKESILALKSVKIGVITAHVTKEDYFVKELNRILTNGQAIPINDPVEFFEGKRPDLDALFMTGEGGSYWTLRYPQFTVVYPTKPPMRVAAGLPVARDDELRSYLDLWIRVKKQQGKIDRLIDHWVYGKTAEQKTKRWSVIRDVLGWVED